MTQKNTPEKNWVFLPPSLRPIVIALSSAVIGIVLWDKATAPTEVKSIVSADAASVTTAHDAPISRINLEVKRTTQNVPMEKVTLPPKLSQNNRAAGKPVEIVEKPTSLKPPLSEEERSAQNEKIISALEQEKKKMGISKVLPRAHVIYHPAKPDLPALYHQIPSSLKSEEKSGNAISEATSSMPKEASSDVGLILNDASSLSQAWVLLGFSGNPPAFDFKNGRIALIKPSGTKIVSITPSDDSITVSYRQLLPKETAKPLEDRMAKLGLTPKNVRFVFLP